MDKNRSILSNNYFFAGIIALLLLVAAVFYDQPHIAMWLGFGIAGFSAISNDSIQTLGTFLASNSKRPWWLLWLFIGGVMLLVFAWGWYVGAGDVAHGRLEKIPQPTEFHFLHLVAPIVLLVITKFKMPVSTTFLILSVFSSKSTIEGMLFKSFLGYGVAFISAYILWFLVSKIFKSDKASQKPAGYWYVLQWLATAFLWSSWLMQDIANVAVFLPRALSLEQFIAFSAFLFLVMGFIFFIKGGSIQEVVKEKKDIGNVKSATLIDFIYAIILYIFKEINNLPMSTTWVFLGLLAGRELALALYSGAKDPDQKSGNYKTSLILVMKDLARAGMGLIISIGLALMIQA